MKGGAAAILKEIQERFRAVHHDQRSREDVKADAEMSRALEPTTPPVEPVAQPTGKPMLQPPQHPQHIDQSNLQRDQERTEVRFQAYTTAAMRSPLIAKHTPRRGNVGGSWQVEAPSESAEELFNQALRDLGLDEK